MSIGIQLETILGREALFESDEPQLVYVLVHAIPHGSASKMPKMPLNLCLVIDRSSSMRGERLFQVKEAARRIVDQMSGNDYFSLITFNDRADIVVSAQRAAKKDEIRRKIAGIEAAGGTEMATGLATALQDMQRVAIMGRMINRILLLTDGRTYGDESLCVQLARRAQDRRIGITALGIGHEWNEDLLETMAARENSRAEYITSSAEITRVFAEELKRMETIFAQNVSLHVHVAPGGMLRSFDRVEPFIAPVSLIEQQDRVWAANLGDWPGTDQQTFLLELAAPPLRSGKQVLAQLTLHYYPIGPQTNMQEVRSLLPIQVLPNSDAMPAIDQQVKYWLERLVAYRLQAQAWQDIESGEVEDASRRLKMAGTRLLESGETELAQTVEAEATRLLRSGQASAEGRKRIKYGTRGLIGQHARLPEKSER